MKIKKIGLITASGFIAAAGDIEHFDNPKQLQKLAGYTIMVHDSGKHNGESRISYRDRKHLRYVLCEVVLSLIGKNTEFREIYTYYRTRRENQKSTVSECIITTILIRKEVMVFCSY